MDVIQKTIKASICLTTYNGAKYLQQQLDSFSAQSVLPDELVVCDDGSTDATCEIIERFKQIAPFEVRLYKNENNLGYAQNFSKALGLCKGDFVFLSDQDDVWLQKKIEMVTSVFDSDSSVQLVIHDLIFCDSNLLPIGQKKLERIKSVSDPMKAYVTGMATAIRKEYLKLCLPIPAGITHDLWLHSCANLLGVKKIHNEPLAYYRRHENNATASGVLNVAKKTSRLDFYINALRFSDTTGLKNNLHVQLELKKWLKQNENFLVLNGYISEVKFSEIKRELSQIISAHQKRLFNRSMSRLERINYVFLLYISGKYRFFSGIKSAVRDLLLK